MKIFEPIRDNKDSQHRIQAYSLLLLQFMRFKLQHMYQFPMFIPPDIPARLFRQSKNRLRLYRTIKLAVNLRRLRITSPGLFHVPHSTVNIPAPVQTVGHIRMLRAELRKKLLPCLKAYFQCLVKLPLSHLDLSEKIRPQAYGPHAAHSAECLKCLFQYPLAFLQVPRIYKARARWYSGHP